MKKIFQKIKDVKIPMPNLDNIQNYASRVKDYANRARVNPHLRAGAIYGIPCFVVGLAIGSSFNSSNSLDEKVMRPNPKEILLEDRNKDGLLDMVQRYPDGNDVVVYAYKDQNGRARYTLDKKIAEAQYTK